MNAIKEIKGLKYSNHDYVRDNYNFTYEPSYPGQGLLIVHAV